MGVAGAGVSNDIVVTTGIAGLLAGALSMAAGEYVSVRAQREMYEYQIALEREELAEYPEEEAEELALIYAARGLELEQARDLARRTIAQPEHALQALSREELGIDPDSLGSPWSAAAWSFVSFAFGALVPLAPFAFASANGYRLEAAAGASALGLFVIGMTISLFTGRNALVGGLRMLLIGGGAALATHFIGRLLGVAFAA
jgi:VIT1/CCC1 family predicted Fe2+/Mn2+ transporter